MISRRMIRQASSRRSPLTPLAFGLLRSSALCAVGCSDSRANVEVVDASVPPLRDATPAATLDAPFPLSDAYWGHSNADADAARPEPPVRAFAFGASTCAIKTDGILKCWGANSFGQVGNRDADPSAVTTPALVSGISATLVAGSATHVCASDGTTVSCWGKNQYGALGHDSSQDTDVCPDATPCARTPHLVAGVRDVVQLGIGLDFSCALTTDATVTCWGKNDLGQLGADGAGMPLCGDAPCRATPASIAGLTDAVELAVGESQSCVRKSDGTVFCWGRRYDGVLSPTPTEFPDLAATRHLALGARHACVIYQATDVGCWGENGSYQTGLGGAYDGTYMTPFRLSRSFGYRQLALGGMHTCGVTEEDVVRCWGASGAGQLGYYPGSYYCAGRFEGAVLLPTLQGTAYVSAGSEHTCTTSWSGDVRCFGRDDSGQLGRGALGGNCTSDAWSQVGSRPTLVEGL